jgi:PAS domain-containing protein
MSSSPTQSSLPVGRPLLLVVEEDASQRASIWEGLAESYDVAFAADEREAETQLGRRDVALVLVDDASGDLERAFAIGEHLSAVAPGVPVALLVQTGDEELAVEALRRGFVDLVVKRTDRLRSDLMRRRIETNLELWRLKRENERLQHAIEDSQARLFNVYDSLDDVIIQIDHECRLVSMNRSAAAVANIEPKEGIGRLCWQLFDFFPCEQRAKKEICPIYRTFLEGETIRGLREDARTKSVAQFMTFITTLRGEDYTVYRETDVTEKRRLEERIAAALRSLGVSPEGDG